MSTCIKVASRWLENNEVDAVIVAAVDLCASKERCFLDGIEDGGDGAAAFVLQRHDSLFSSYAQTTTSSAEQKCVDTKEMNENLLRRVGQCGIAFEAAKLVQHCVNSSTFHLRDSRFEREIEM